jgi:hypothetical protein
MSATIGKITESLRNLLVAQMTPSTNVTLLSPAETSSHTTRVNLFLYRVTPNPHLNNQDWRPKPGTVNQLVAPPLTLNLHYLLTAVAPLDPNTGLADAHGLLGEAMRVLHENAFVPQAFLENGLKQGDVKVTLLSLDMEELSKIWLALQQDFQFSVAYEVSYVEVPAKAERPLPRRVVRPELEVHATARLPALFGMNPRSGPVGTDLQFAGENLATWKATVFVGGKVAIKDAPLFDDHTFTAKVPPGLARGLYEVEVNVANLTRFQSVFEVTP